MGKTERGTPKDLAIRMKSKGLQKLRWYCQMCQKQCRDENGFKCHTMSESHQRQLLLFAENPDKYLDTFSEDFYTDYLHLLKRRFGTKRVHANNVYQEYIHDKDHIHMNATQWETLTDFVKWLGREGHCIVDETEKGWYVAFIDRDPETLMRQEKAAKMVKYEQDAEERQQAFIEQQIRFAMANGKGVPEAVYTDLKRDGDDPIKLGMSLSSRSSTVPTTSALSVLAAMKDKRKVTGNKNRKENPKKRSALEEIMEEEKRKKIAKQNDEALVAAAEEAAAAASAAAQVKNEPAWLVKDIIVKVVTKSLGGTYYSRKGVVVRVVSEYGAKVRLLECGTQLKLDQTHLETVVPACGRSVMLVAGQHKGTPAVLDSIQKQSFSATVTLTGGEHKGKTLTNVPYEHFSKLTT